MSLTSFVSTINQGDACALSLGAWSSSLPLSNLQTGKLGDVARSAHQSHASTCFKATAVPAGLTSRVLYLIRDNLTGPAPGVTPSETTRYRVRWVYGSLGSPATFFPRALPVGILASTNLSGAVSALQEADLENKVGAWLTATSATTSTDVRASLQASTCGLQTGSGLQTALVLVRRTGGGGSNPTCTVDLYRSGVLVTNLLTGTAISSTTGTILTLPWDATVLGGSPPSAANLEIRVRGTASATATVEVGGIHGLGEFASNGSATIGDSGWMTRNLPVGYWGPQRSINQLYLPFIAANDFTWDEIWWEAQAGANFDSYFEAGRLWIGQALTFQDALGLPSYEDLGLSILPVDPSVKDRMRSGALDVDIRRGWKEVAMIFSQLSKACALDTIFESVMRFSGMTRNALWVPRPTELDRACTYTALGTFKSLAPVHQASPSGYGVSITIEETVG